MEKLQDPGLSVPGIGSRWENAMGVSYFGVDKQRPMKFISVYTIKPVLRQAKEVTVHARTIRCPIRKSYLL